MTQWLFGNVPHLVVVPILLPLLTAVAMLLLGEQRRTWKLLLNLASSLAGLAVAVALLQWVDDSGAQATVGIYLPANWDVPFGIVLTADRLTALMLALTAFVSVGAVIFSAARWHRAGVHFHALFQLQLMGLNGVFLTADLFNLFVFFEVTLAASYGLLLHGSGKARVLSGLHYIAINLVASSLFLIGVALLYGVIGTLNMADLAQRIPQVLAEDRGLLHAGAAILGIAFLIKVAMWPLNFWLVPAYTAATAPVGALFALLTKLGVYTVLRIWTLFFPEHATGSALFGAAVLTAGGLLTVALGAFGMVASRQLGRIAAFSAIVSSGTLLAAIGFAEGRLLGGALFYLLSSTLAISALFLLVELIDRARQTAEEDIEPDELPQLPEERTNLDDQEEALVGRVIPAATAFLGLSFVLCALLIAGLPPLSGFVGKVGMLTALLDAYGLEGSTTAPPFAAATWLLLAAIVGSGFLALIVFTRAGSQFFWVPEDRAPPPFRIVECVPVAVLLAACMLLTVRAEPVMRYTLATAEALQDPARYIEAVLSARPMPAPTAATLPSSTDGGVLP